jgi:hypothetical protein
MGRNQFGRDQRDYISFRNSDRNQFRESDSYDNDRQTEEMFGRYSKDHGRFNGINRFGEENPRHDRYQDDQYSRDYDPTYEDELGMKHPYEHGGRSNRWSDDFRSEASHENHVGKGPKGYQRSPDRIKEEACEILARDWRLDASDIEVEYEDNCLVLKGGVQSRRDKRRAEYLVENISGVDDVINRLQLQKHAEGWIPGIDKLKHQNQMSGGKDEQER